MMDLDELIEYAEKNEFEFDWMRDTERHELWGSIVKYLREYRDSRHLLHDDRIVAYWGRIPIVKIEDKYFAIAEYVPKHKAWRCHKMRWEERFGSWSNYDDENYIIRDDGTLVCKEYGWELREVYPEEGAEL